MIITFCANDDRDILFGVATPLPILSVVVLDDDVDDGRGGRVILVKNEWRDD